MTCDHEDITVDTEAERTDRPGAVVFKITTTVLCNRCNAEKEQISFIYFKPVIIADELEVVEGFKKELDNVDTVADLEA